MVQAHKLSLQCIIQVADSPQSCVRMVDSGISLRQLTALRATAEVGAFAVDGIVIVVKLLGFF